MSTRGAHALHLSHSPLPAPGIASTSQSKAHVLAGVQDAYWSDDDAADNTCPLCMDEMDLSDLNFKPCPCGYQICRLCWHHIKENLNGRCPACRRVYTENQVEFRAPSEEEQIRLNRQKKKREKERKELDALNRRRFLDVRIVQRNVVYVVGLGSRFAKEELIPSLRSNEFFGQYGKISKIILVKRNQTGHQDPVVGLYITYQRREDAARAIQAVDGTPSPGGGKDPMRASYGTTKYCVNFLRNASCTTHGCLDLHEWGDEQDCFTKEDLTTLQHAIKDTEHQRIRANGAQTKKNDDSDSSALPRAAAWGAQRQTPAPSPAATGLPPGPQSKLPQSPRRQTARTRNQPQAVPAKASAESVSKARSGPTHDRKHSKVPSQPSRPTTPGASAPLPKAPAPPLPTEAPRVVQNAETSEERSPPATENATSRAETPQSFPTSPHVSTPAVPPGLPPPPGLAPPPGLPPPSSHARESTGGSSYQMSSQAQALMDEVRVRRESIVPSAVVQSPFPDFDRMLQNLGDGSFSFNFSSKLEAKLAEPVDLGRQQASTFSGMLGPVQGHTASPYHSNPSGLPTSETLFNTSKRLPAVEAPIYTGSFNPFAEHEDDTSAAIRKQQLEEDSRRSRFGFARERQPTPGNSYSPSPLVNGDTLPGTPLYSNPTVLSPRPSVLMSSRQQQSWAGFSMESSTNRFQPQQPQQTSYPIQQHQQSSSQHIQQQEFTRPPPGLSLPPNHVRQQVYQPSGQFQPFEASAGTAALKQLMNIGRNQAEAVRPSTDNLQHHTFTNQPYNDPAIMSMRLNPVSAQHQQQEAMYMPPGQDAFSPPSGPPPGLGHSAMRPPATENGQYHPYQQSSASGPSSHTSPSVAQVSASISPASSPVPAQSPVFKSSEFPALPTLPSLDPQPRREQQQPFIQPTQPRVPEPKPQPSPPQPAPPPIATRKLTAKEKRAAKRQALQNAAAAPVNQAADENLVVLKDVADTELTSEGLPDKIVEIEKPSAAPSVLPVTSSETSPSAITAPPPALAAASSTPAPTPKGPKHTPAQKTKATAAPPPPPPPPPPPSEPAVVEQAPLLSRKSKKVKAPKALKLPAKIENNDAPEPQVTSAEQTQDPTPLAQHVSTAPSGKVKINYATIEQLLVQLGNLIDTENLAFFDPQHIKPKSPTPLRYGPLVHALSALSVGGGAFANTLPSGSIDTAVSSFQQLLETLTQTISDLLRLLPRTTWDESSSFDGVLRDMLKAEDFLDENAEEPPTTNGTGGREDEVAALTLALERRARWMEVQLAKLEELHRDINTAAVRAVLAMNDRGWDPAGLLPHGHGRLAEFDMLGVVEEDGMTRVLTAEELEAQLADAKMKEAAAEQELKLAMFDAKAHVPF